MTFVALTMALSMATPDATPLTFVHGDEQIVTWLDRGAVQRTGDRVRLRVLRIRHPDQAFWVVQEIDCALDTWALVDNRSVDGGDETRPALEGEALPNPIHRDDHSENALRDAVCDGVFVDVSIAPAPDVATAVARLAETKAAAVLARPLQLMVLSQGASPLFMDRATLESGGPQVEVRSLKMTGRGQGLWSGWLLDCERSDLAMNLEWTAPLVDGTLGPMTRDRDYDAREVANAEELALVMSACDPLVWARPVHASIAAAMRAAEANPR